MNIAIIEDSLEERQLLSQYINHFYSEKPIYKQITEFESGEKFLEVWKQGAYDLIFLDIYLKNITGITVAETIRKTDSDSMLIFITNSLDYAVKSFRLRAFDYLIKPLSYVDFTDSMSLCDKELRHRSRFIELKESRTYIKIRLNDIIFTDYFNHYIQIHTVERMIRSYMRFEEFSPMLLCYPQFLCCYRNCIVNMDHISVLSKNDITMINGEHMPITRSKRQWIQQQFTDYQFQTLKESH